MPEPIEPLILDLLESLRTRPRPYDEVMEAWRTSCPQLPIWEEANDRGFIDRTGPLIELTRTGREHLAKHRA